MTSAAASQATLASKNSMAEPSSRVRSSVRRRNSSPLPSPTADSRRSAARRTSFGRKSQSDDIPTKVSWGPRLDGRGVGRGRAEELGKAERSVTQARDARAGIEAELQQTIARRGLAERALQERSERHDALARRVYDARSARERLQLRAEQAGAGAQALKRRLEQLELELEALGDAPDEHGAGGDSEQGGSSPANANGARTAALVQAGSYMAVSKIRWDDYLVVLRESRKELMEKGERPDAVDGVRPIEELDAGPIIAQATAAMTHRDTVADLARKGKDLEVMVLAKAVRAHLRKQVLLHRNRTIVFE